MRTIVFADVHGNLPALITLISRERADRWLSLGDIVGYGPWANECVDVVQYLCEVKLRGNHENYYLCHAIDRQGMAERFFDFCHPTFDRFDEIGSWKDVHNEDGIKFRHTINNDTIYPDSLPEWDGYYIIAHSHHQSVHYKDGGFIYCIGSVGQNRQYINKIDYLVIDRKIELMSMLYDESTILEEMRRRGYPQECIEYYSKKGRADVL